MLHTLQCILTCIFVIIIIYKQKKNTKQLIKTKTIIKTINITIAVKKELS